MSRLREVVRWIWAVLLLATGASHAARRNLGRRGAIVIMAFHRILDDVDFRRTQSLSGMVMRRRTFERLSMYVTQQCDVVDLSWDRPREWNDRPRVAFTFDDGWIDNYTAVFPTVREHGIPITIFVCPGLLGRCAPFWPERVAASLKAAIPGICELEIETAINRLKTAPPQLQRDMIASDYNLAEDGPDRTMSWAQIEELNGAGVTIGAHTQTHQVLTALETEPARREVVGSKTCLERRLNKACACFAYPNGNHSESTRRLLVEAGFVQAFTMDRSAWTPNSDPLAIPRANAAESDVTGPAGRFSAAMFEYTMFWKISRALRDSGGVH
jgi:peptidoglycan/xylan/chitin deacetylase (PgdA/CDA1 family)